MEIARLEVSTAAPLRKNGRNCKSELCPVWGKSTKSKKKKPQSSAGATSQGLVATKQGQVATGDPDPVENSTKGPPLLPETCYRCGKGGDTKRHRTARLWMLLAEGVDRKGHYEKVCLQGKCSAHSLKTQANSAGAGASEPLYFNNEGQPVYTYMVSVPHANKHLIKFPVALDPTTLKGNNMDSPQSTVLLKADTGADVNLMNRQNISPTLWETAKC